LLARWVTTLFSVLLSMLTIWKQWYFNPID
jgi:hypothetical protein